MRTRTRQKGNVGAMVGLETIAQRCDATIPMLFRMHYEQGFPMTYGPDGKWRTTVAEIEAWASRRVEAERPARAAIARAHRGDGVTLRRAPRTPSGSV